MNKSRLLLVGLAVGGGFWAVAQKPQDQVFRDRQGRFKLWNMTSHEVTFNPKGDTVFVGEGSPVRGRSEAQNLTLSCLDLEAVLERGAQGSLLLKEAKLKGAVELTALATGSNGTTSRELKTESAQITDGPTESRTILSAPFVLSILTSSDGASTRATASAGNGLVVTGSLRTAKTEIRTAELQGGAKLDFSGPTQSGTLTSSRILLKEYPLSAITLPSAFQFEGQRRGTDGARTTVSFSGGAGELGLDFAAKDKDQVRSAVIREGSKVRIVQVRADGEKRTIDAEAPRLEYSLGSRSLTLSGGVKYSALVETPGKEPMGGEGQSETLVVTFNEKGEVVDYRAKSGKVRVEQGAKP